MKRRLQISFELVLFILVLGLHAYAIFAPANSLMNWYTSDDGFYYFKTAQNISEGYGVTFDRIAPTNGFHPLWMVILVPIFALARFDLILPLRIVLAVMALFNAGSTALLYRLTARVLSRPAGVVVGLFWAFFPRIHDETTTLGMETSLTAFCLILLLYLIVKLEADRLSGKDQPRQLIWIGVAATLAMLARLDTIFVVAVLGIWVVIRARPLRYLLVGDLVLALVVTFSSFLMRLGFDLYFFYSNYAVWMAGLALGLRVVVFLMMGLYDADILHPSWRSAVKIAAGVSLSSALVAGIMMVMIQLGAVARFPRAVLVLDWALALALTLGLRYGIGWVLRKQGIDLNAAAVEMRLKLKWKEWLANGLRYYGPLLGTLILYMVVNYLYTGTTSPVSGQIKRWWGTIYTVYGYPEKDISGVLGFNEDPDRNPWWEVYTYPAAIGDSLARKAGVKGEGMGSVLTRSYYGYGAGAGLALLMLGLLLTGRRWLRQWAGDLLLVPLLVGSFVQISSYKMTTYVETLHWYWVAQTVIKVLIMAILLECVFRLLERVKARKIFVWGISAALGVYLFVNCAAQVVELTPWKVQKGDETAYLAGSRGLEKATPPGAIIGSTGGGGAGYFTAGRTVVNLDGLISSYSYFQQLKSGHAQEYLDRIGLQYVYAPDYMLTFSEPYKDIFKDRLKYIDSVAGTALYRYLPAKP